MTISPGTRLGPYEILAPLGAGGMGEVYRGRDTRLERTVAIKVLLDQLSGSTEVRQRFECDASAAGWEALLSPKVTPGRHLLTVTFQAGDRRRVYPPRAIEIAAPDGPSR